MHILRLGPLFLLGSLIAGCTGDSNEIAITIDLSDAKALLTVSESSSSSELMKGLISDEEALGYLRKILEDGTIEAVIRKADGSASSVVPTSLFSGPDGKIYITFDQEVLIGGVRCFLARGEIGGTLECYGPDNGLGDFHGTVNSMAAQEMSQQFDSANNLFLLFSYENDSEGNLITSIKKLSPDGVISYVIQYPYEEVTIVNFVVLSDGTVIFSGWTEVTGREFTRRTTSEGGVENLDFTLGEGAIVEGAIVSEAGDLFNGLTRYTIEDGEIIENETISLSDLSLLDSLAGGDSLALVDSVDSSRDQSLLEDISGNIYLIGGRIYRIYPGDPVIISSEDILEEDEDEGRMREIDFARTSGNFLYYSGIDSNNDYFFRRLDLTDETFPETDLLNGEDIEVYRFQVWSDGDILFGGLRLSDNQLILGEIDGETLELTVTTTTSTRIDELVLID